MAITQTGVWLDSVLYKKVRQRALDEDTTMRGIFEKALSAYLETPLAVEGEAA